MGKDKRRDASARTHGKGGKKSEGSVNSGEEDTSQLARGRKRARTSFPPASMAPLSAIADGMGGFLSMLGGGAVENFSRKRKKENEDYDVRKAAKLSQRFADPQVMGAFFAGAAMAGAAIGTFWARKMESERRNKGGRHQPEGLKQKWKKSGMNEGFEKKRGDASTSESSEEEEEEEGSDVEEEEKEEQEDRE
eukprot:1522273-Rhodomonas_salina.1